jgi:hypothetical protein
MPSFSAEEPLACCARLGPVNAARMIRVLDEPLTKMGLGQ